MYCHLSGKALQRFTFESSRFGIAAFSMSWHGRIPFFPFAGRISRISGLLAPSSRARRCAFGLADSRLILPVLFLFFLIGGCESELETGYKPRPLNATSTDRRAYYAPPFTPEAASSTPSDKPTDSEFRRPGPY